MRSPGWLIGAIIAACASGIMEGPQGKSVTEVISHVVCPKTASSRCLCVESWLALILRLDHGHTLVGYPAYTVAVAELGALERRYRQRDS